MPRCSIRKASPDPLARGHTTLVATRAKTTPIGVNFYRRLKVTARLDRIPIVQHCAQPGDLDLDVPYLLVWICLWTVIAVYIPSESCDNLRDISLVARWETQP